MMRGERFINLYFLQGSIVTGETAISGTIDDDDDADNTKLWHMRLGHAGEKAM